MDPTEEDRAYEALLARAEDGSLPAAAGNDERRRHPRFQIHTDDLWIDEMSEFTVRDVSATGIGLTSEYPLAEGRRIQIGLRDRVSVEAVVIRCRLVESASQYWGPLFHIRCRFAELQGGKALLVNAAR